MSKNLYSIDFIVIIAYLILVSVIGIVQGKKEKDTEDFFLAGRQMPWIMVFFSVLATEISAVTFIGTPEEGYKATYLYIQFAIGSLIGRFLIAYVLLPAFYENKIDTIYGYLKNRYGIITHLLSVMFFFITRIMASGVRLYAASLALSVVTKWSLSLSLTMIVLVVVFYTCTGGLKAVIWTDMFQLLFFLGGAVLSLYFLLKGIPDGFNGLLKMTDSYYVKEGINKFQMLKLNFSFSDPHSFIVSVLFGCFMTFAALGADQDLAQRLLSCKKYKESQRAIILSGFLTFPIVLLFLFIGTCLWGFYSANPLIHLPSSSSEIYPHFIVNELPKGIAGLLLAGIMAAAMSSLDSTLNSISSSLMLDVYKPYINKNATDKKMLFLSRISIISIALLLILFAWFCQGYNRILLISFKMVSFTYGALLGVFCSGILTKRGSDKGNIIAMFGSTFFVFIIHYGQNLFISKKIIQTQIIGWSWYIIIGTLSTIMISVLFKAQSEAKPLVKIFK